MAVKRYHTSAPGVLEQELAITGFDEVLNASVPAVLVHVVPVFNCVAPVHSSFDGGV